MPRELIRRTMSVTKGFFELSFDERSKYMSNDIRSPVRYGTSFNQNNDGVFSWRDFLKLNCQPLNSCFPHWPSSPIDLREVGMEYAKENKRVFMVIMEAVFESLGLGLGLGLEMKREFEEGSQMMVMNCFPACPEPELTMGMPAHSDYGFLTLLVQDDVEGLQVQFEDEWITVQPLPDSILVNVGDHLEIFSNGKYKSVLHRVFVNSSKSRISIASLHSLPSEKVVSPSPFLINEETPKLYMDTDFEAFLNFMAITDSTNKSFLQSRKLIHQNL
ncbi:Flavanone 3-dioxygenase protein [Dioscorea alata]|uniref:Flavanone 3-dioxygenase protein n=1 Tax=Dioscorea alata TaxID=55571 RepID=A0ACB7V7Y2_DIOAL|nr:Flavanone 3-dioxygenase protein [Dioscorea alata]